jgi:hypothetical protein
MMVTIWGPSFAWLDVSLVVFVILAILGATFNARHFASLGQAALSTPDGAVPETIRAQINDPMANASIVLMMALAVGIVFMMTTKPDLVVSLITVVVALAVGFLVAQQMRQPATASVGEATSSQAAEAVSE